MQTVDSKCSLSSSEVFLITQINSKWDTDYIGSMLSRIFQTGDGKIFNTWKIKDK